MSGSCSEVRELSDRLAKGDRSAFNTLFNMYSGLVMSVALRVLRAKAEAEEVVQDAFMEAWRKAAHYQPERASFEAWIVTIARSRALDRLRTRQSQSRSAQLAEISEVQLERARPPDQLFESQSCEYTLRRSLLTLPTVQRETLELAYREGLSQSEIAARTGTALGTVKSRMRAATRRLALFAVCP